MINCIHILRTDLVEATIAVHIEVPDITDPNGVSVRSKIVNKTMVPNLPQNEVEMLNNGSLYEVVITVPIDLLGNSWESITEYFAETVKAKLMSEINSVFWNGVRIDKDTVNTTMLRDREEQIQTIKVTLETGSRKLTTDKLR